MSIDLPEIVLNINNPITMLSLMRCAVEWELLAGLYKAPNKPSVAELGEAFDKLFAKLDAECIKTHNDGMPALLKGVMK